VLRLCRDESIVNVVIVIVDYNDNITVKTTKYSKLYVLLTAGAIRPASLQERIGAQIHVQSKR